MAELLDMKALVEPGRALTNEEIRRYSRHLLIPDIDLVGQQRIVNSRVLCIGAGGLGLLISESVSLFQWSRLATLLIVVVALVVSFDALSRRIRQALL